MLDRGGPSTKRRLAAIGLFLFPAGAEITEMRADKHYPTEGRDDAGSRDVQLRVASIICDERGAAGIGACSVFRGTGIFVNLIPGVHDRCLDVAHHCLRIVRNGSRSGILYFLSSGVRGCIPICRIVLGEPAPIWNNGTGHHEDDPEQGTGDHPFLAVDPKPAEHHDHGQGHDKKRNDPV